MSKKGPIDERSTPENQWERGERNYDERHGTFRPTRYEIESRGIKVERASISKATARGEGELQRFEGGTW